MTASVLNAVTFPDADVKRRYDALIGIDDVKRALLNALRATVHPESLRAWAKRHPAAANAVELVLDRPALFILGGDVGTGKTALAESIGDALARAEAANVTLFSLSLAARGTGYVGEMTQRIVSAFDEVRAWGEQRRSAHKGARAAGLLFVDEADAIAQSRESLQMHHEDRAGVNALIRGIDDLSRVRAPVAVIMATNRLDSLDPAVRRRAALVFDFGRPDERQRRAVLTRLLPTLAADVDFERLVMLTGPDVDRPYGCTYSDLVQRVVPAAVLNAYEARCDLTMGALLEAAMRNAPTPPFQAQSG